MRNRKRTRSPNELTRREKEEMNARLAQYRAMEERRLRDDATTPQQNGPDTSERAVPKRLDVERLTEAARQYNPHMRSEIEQLIEAFGTDDRDFILPLVIQLSYATAGSTLGHDAIDFIVDVEKYEKQKN